MENKSAVNMGPTIRWSQTFGNRSLIGFVPARVELRKSPTETKAFKKGSRKQKQISIYGPFQTTEELVESNLNKLQGCTDLILNCPNLKIFAFSHPVLETVETLYVGECKNLEHIGSFPNLLVLFASNMTHLKHIEASPYLDRLDASDCFNLNHVEPMHYLRKLNIGGCDKLRLDFRAFEYLDKLEIRGTTWTDEELKQLSECKSLRDLNCSQCMKLEVLPPIPNLEWLVCGDCANLHTIQMDIKCCLNAYGNTRKLDSIVKQYDDRREIVVFSDFVTNRMSDALSREIDNSTDNRQEQ